jgi:pimeloyl-[acyl-carrier protein] synthase
MTIDGETLSLSNLLQAEARANPYALYARIRTEDPVHWDEPMGFWVATRYADALAILHDQRFVKAQGLEAALNRFPEQERDGARPVFAAFAKQMLYADPPYHTKLRGLVSKAFTPRAVERIRAHIQQVVDDLLAAAEPAGRMDIIQQLAYPLPVIVILEMLGLPLDERAQFKTWSDDFAATIGVLRRSPELLAKGRDSLTALTQYIGQRSMWLRARGQDDLLSALVGAEEEGRMLSEEELVANTLLLLVAGHETTTNLIGNGLLALLRNPEQMRRLREQPALIGSAIEELMRFDNPVQIVWRYATDDVGVGEKQIRCGQIVNVLLGAANRDPEQFAHPDTLDLEREIQRHLGFSLGTHFCLGAPLARMEGEIALTTLLRRFPALQLETQELEWQENPTFRGLKALPVRFTV